MAFAFGFPQDVTELIYSMRDWRWELVRNGVKTPSASCFSTERLSFPDALTQPRVWPSSLPVVYIESDEEAFDFGEICNTDDSLQSVNKVQILVQDPLAGISGYQTYTLREQNRSGRVTLQGRTPAKLQRLQEKREKHIQDMWFQCEPCE